MSAQGKGVKRAWFLNDKLAKECKLPLPASKDKEAADVLIVDDFDKNLKSSAASLHCRLYGKTLASSEAIWQNGNLQGQHVSFHPPAEDVIVCASADVAKKHNKLLRELKGAKRIKLVSDADGMMAASKASAFSQVRWLGTKAEVPAFATKLLQAHLPASRAVACTASYFVENIGSAA